MLAGVEHEVRLRRRREGRREIVRVSLVEGRTLMEAARAAGLPIASACGGGSLCARCGVEILAGAGHLTPEPASEAEAKRRNRIEPRLRLACVARVAGPVEVTAAYW